MKLKDYIQKKSSIIGLGVSVEAVEDFILINGFGLEHESEDISVFDKLFLNLVLMLLVKPDISEGDYSETYNRDSVLKWYKLECARLGVEDDYTSSLQPKVRDKSYLA